MSYKVLVAQPVSSIGLDYLVDRGYEVVMATDNSVETLTKEIADFDALLARNGDYPKSIFEAAPKLKVIGKHGVGTNNIDIEGASELGIQVTFGPYSNTNSVAEHTLALILALATDLLYMDGQTRKGNWGARDTTKAIEINGKTLGIIGLGRIGQTVAKLADAIGMTVIGYDRYVPIGTILDGMEQVTDLEEIFQRSDFISLHVPLTEETKNLVGNNLLALMKPTAYLINCARGGVVDEAALYEALKTKQINGAGINCFVHEPASQEDPLFTLNNVIVGPHSAAQTKEGIDRMSLHAAIGIDEVLSGKIPSWPANHPANPRK